VSARPDEPKGADSVFYRGWECGFEPDRDRYTREGWTAYKGGCDLDAPQVTAVSWTALLDAVDDEEDET
jgi:hypothetical protein